MNLVSIIAVNYNQPEVTEAMLRSVREKNRYPAVEIIVVDNGSDVSRVPEWELAYPEVRFIRSEENLGFAGGNNLGMRTAAGDYFLLINNDTEITADLVGTLAGTLDRRPEAGMVSPKILYFHQPGMIQYAGYTPMNFLTGRNACIGQFEEDQGQYDHREEPTGYVHGAAMMVRKEAVQRAGPMAENYFLYYEELDWCEQIRRAGYSVLVNTDAVIFHKESVSVGKRTALKEYFMNRNRILFIRKNAPFLSRLCFAAFFALVVAPRNLLGYLVHGERNFIPVFFRAVIWNFTNGPDSTRLGFPLKK